MARKKVDTIKMVIEKAQVDVPIYLSVDSGNFIINLDRKIALLLGVEETLKGKDLKALRESITTAYKGYINNSAKIEFVICILYKAGGYYSVSDKSNFQSIVSSGDPSNLGFDFTIYGKKTLGDRVDSIYYEAVKGYGTVYHNESHLKDPDRLFLSKQCHVPPRGTIIPYTEVAHEKLKRAKSSLRELSAMINDFVDQDTEQISLQLESGVFNLIEK